MEIILKYDPQKPAGRLVNGVFKPGAAYGGKIALWDKYTPLPKVGEYYKGELWIRELPNCAIIGLKNPVIAKASYKLVRTVTLLNDIITGWPADKSAVVKALPYKLFEVISPNGERDFKEFFYGQALPEGFKWLPEEIEAIKKLEENKNEFLIKYDEVEKIPDLVVYGQEYYYRYYNGKIYRCKEQSTYRFRVDICLNRDSNSESVEIKKYPSGYTDQADTEIIHVCQRQVEREKLFTCYLDTELIDTSDGTWKDEGRNTLKTDYYFAVGRLIKTRITYLIPDEYKDKLSNYKEGINVIENKHFIPYYRYRLNLNAGLTSYDDIVIPDYLPHKEAYLYLVDEKGTTRNNSRFRVTTHPLKSDEKYKVYLLKEFSANNCDLSQLIKLRKSTREAAKNKPKSLSKIEALKVRADGRKYAVLWHYDWCNKHSGEPEVIEVSKINEDTYCCGRFDAFFDSVEECDNYINNNMLNYYE